MLLLGSSLSLFFHCCFHYTFRTRFRKRSFAARLSLIGFSISLALAASSSFCLHFKQASSWSPLCFPLLYRLDGSFSIRLDIKTNSIFALLVWWWLEIHLMREGSRIIWRGSKKREDKSSFKMKTKCRIEAKEWREKILINNSAWSLSWLDKAILQKPRSLDPKQSKEIH